MPTLKNHPSEETIELYALGRLAEKLVPPLEEHLLVCERCQDALREEDSFFQSIMALSKCKRRGTGGV
jgi:anti-sigma factor ChrR (cupin superfamily)